MKCFGNIRLQEKFSKCNPCFYYLTAVGFLEALLMAGGTDFYYEHKNYLLFPVFMFFGAAFMQDLTPSAKRKLLLGVLAVAWFLVIQKHRSHMGWKLYPFSWFPAICLMAYPFASITQDGENNRGIAIYSTSFLSAAVILVFYGIILLLGKVPEKYSSMIYLHHGIRFALMWNPNITGCIFMVAAILCCVFHNYYNKERIKWLFAIIGIVYFIDLSLTNSRIVVLIFCIMAGGYLFFWLLEKNWKYYISKMILGCAVVAGLFLISEIIYDFHGDLLISRYTHQLEETKDSDLYVPDKMIDAEFVGCLNSIDDELNDCLYSINDVVYSISSAIMSSEEIESELGMIKHDNSVRTYSKNIRNLNGRIPIWRAALRAIREDPSILLYGCEHVGDTISLYTEQEFMHSHNSWVEITMSLGLPGLIIALIYTWIAVWNSMVLLWHQTVPLWKKGIALLVLGLLAAGFMEPYLFFSNQFYHFIDFMFFLCLGYVRVWVEALPRKFDSSKFPLCLL